MRAFGFDGDMIADLVREGLATAQREILRVGGRTIGEIEAVDEREAIEIAAKEFKQPAKKLMAEPQR